jgi:hypothetical protein
MVECRASRRAARQNRATNEYGSDATAVLDLLELTDLAWHDCYGETSPPAAVLDDIFVVASGDLSHLIAAARLAVEDYRDLRMSADAARA